MASWQQHEFPHDLGGLIFDLLGKPLCGSEFSRFSERVGKPSQDCAVGSTRFYIFRRFGAYLFYEISREVFYSVTFVFDTAAVRYREERPYLAILPFGIENTDNANDVKRKLGLGPSLADWVQGCENGCDPGSRARSYWQHYDVSPYRVTVMFDSVNSRLDLLTVSDLQIIKEMDSCGRENISDEKAVRADEPKQIHRRAPRKPPQRP